MAFYTYARFIAPNEVGGKPGIWGTSLASFHKANASRNTHFPRAMITTGTHDTKRGEGLRMRLAVLTEMPDQWHEWITEWERMRTNGNEWASASSAP